jgi:hypothetical protein
MIDNVLYKYKDRIFCVQVKSKPCVVNIIMRLFSWKRSCGSETVLPKGCTACIISQSELHGKNIRGHCTMYYLPK